MRRVGEQGVMRQLSGCVEHSMSLQCAKIACTFHRDGPSSRRLVLLFSRQSGCDGGGGDMLQPTADNVRQLLLHELTDLLIEIGRSLERQTRRMANVRENTRRGAQSWTRPRSSVVSTPSAS